MHKEERFYAPGPYWAVGASWWSKLNDAPSPHISVQLHEQAHEQLHPSQAASPDLLFQALWHLFHTRQVTFQIPSWEVLSGALTSFPFPFSLL